MFAMADYEDDAGEGALLLAGAGRPAANATARFLASLPALFAPLCADVCEWLAERDVAVNASACLAGGPPGMPSANNMSAALLAASSSTLPQDVCERLANLSAPVGLSLGAGDGADGCTRCLPRAPTLEGDDVIRAALLALLALGSFVGNCYTIHSIRNKAVGAASSEAEREALRQHREN